MAVHPPATQAQSGRSAEPGVSPPPPAPHDSATEIDPLIRAHIEVDALTGEVVMRDTLYLVWSVVLNLRATGYDWERVQRMFPELPQGALRAADRFWQLHAEDIREYVEE